MSQLLVMIKDWPVIVQGALGSALFAIIVFLGQKAAIWLPKAIAKLSVGRRRSYLRNEMIRLRTRMAEDVPTQTYFIVALWYRASRDVIKGLIWLALGLLCGTFLGILEVIGYLGCLYHLFFALAVVRRIPGDDADLEARLDALQVQLDALGDE